MKARRLTEVAILAVLGVIIGTTYGWSVLGWMLFGFSGIYGLVAFVTATSRMERLIAALVTSAIAAALGFFLGLDVLAVFATIALSGFGAGAVTVLISRMGKTRKALSGSPGEKID